MSRYFLSDFLIKKYEPKQEYHFPLNFLLITTQCACSHAPRSHLQYFHFEPVFLAYLPLRTPLYKMPFLLEHELGVCECDSFWGTRSQSDWMTGTYSYSIFVWWPKQGNPILEISALQNKKKVARVAHKKLLFLSLFSQLVHTIPSCPFGGKLTTMTRKKSIVQVRIAGQTWDLLKNLYDWIFRPKILHTKSVQIATIFTKKETAWMH